MVRCPVCKQHLPLLTVKTRFQCPNCRAPLKSSATLALVVVTILWVFGSALFLDNCRGDTNCWLVTDVVVGLIAFVFVGLPVFFFSIRSAETDQRDPERPRE